MDYLERLVQELIKLPDETEWVEFKHNNVKPEMIGKDISALANGAALNEKWTAYMVWGVSDDTHEIVGTEYDLSNRKVGNEELENWLRHSLSPHADFQLETGIIDGKAVQVLTIASAHSFPVAFNKEEYIRVGSYTKKLRDYPALQAKLWDRLRSVQFEEQIAQENLELMDALRQLDYTSYFDQTGTPQPSDIASIAHYLVSDDILILQDNGLYSITNLGAILFAKDLSEFQPLARKLPRIIQYNGTSRLEAVRRREDHRGFALSFKELLSYIEALLPSKETVENGLRVETLGYPSIAIREILGNALIHQDYSLRGTGPLIEVFTDRVEISSPGTLLVEPARIVDTPPRSRNEKMAALCRRMHICEESGTGWDKAVIACELSHQSAPRITVYEDSVRVTLFETKKFADLTEKDRLWCCYMHAVIQFVQGGHLTNASLRERFNIPASSSATVSRLIRQAMENGLIKPVDLESGKKGMKYVPYWA